MENTAAQDDQVSLKLFSEKGTYQKIFPVPAGGLLKINVKELQLDGVPDKDGHLLLGSNGLLSLSGMNGHLSRLSFDRLIHNVDESDYVGLPGNNTCSTESVALFLGTSAGGPVGPFPVMIEYSWSDGTFQDAPEYGTQTTTSNLMQISSGSNGDMATLTPIDGQSHTAVFYGPPTSVTDCPACSADPATPQGSAKVPASLQL